MRKQTRLDKHPSLHIVPAAELPVAKGSCVLQSSPASLSTTRLLNGRARKNLKHIIPTGPYPVIFFSLYLSKVFSRTPYWSWSLTPAARPGPVRPVAASGIRVFPRRSRIEVEYGCSLKIIPTRDARKSPSGAPRKPAQAHGTKLPCVYTGLCVIKALLFAA